MPNAALGPGPGASSPVTAPPDRVFTPALVVFLGIVALALGFAAWQRWPCPDLHGAVVMLADGDLDGDERRRMLRRVVADARQATGVTDRWAGLLAAVALADEPAWRELLRTFGSDALPREVPPPGEREFLHLGDRMLGSVLAAAVTEAAGEREAAIAAWTVAQAQATLAAQPFARQIAAASLARLGAAATVR
jgi:hypothetical protein